MVFPLLFSLAGSTWLPRVLKRRWETRYCGSKILMVMNRHPLKSDRKAAVPSGRIHRVEMKRRHNLGLDWTQCNPDFPFLSACTLWPSRTHPTPAPGPCPIFLVLHLCREKHLSAQYLDAPMFQLCSSLSNLNKLMNRTTSLQLSNATLFLFQINIQTFFEDAEQEGLRNLTSQTGPHWLVR